MFGFNSFASQPFCSIEVPTISMDMHDGFYKKKSEVEKKLAKARQKLIEARREYKDNRKKIIADLVSPKPKEILKPIIKATQEIKALEQEHHEIINTSVLEFEIARLQAIYAIERIKQLAEQDEEDALLALLL